MASNIGYQIFGQDVLTYDLKMFKNRLCSVCSLFTTEDIGFVPFYRVLSQGKTYTMDQILQICHEMGYDQEFREMILLDSIVFNQDRHMGNFGFMVHNETQKIIGFSPLFDFNVSMLCNAMPEDFRDYEAYERNYMVGHKLGGEFLDVGRAIMTEELREKLPEQIILPHHEKYNMSADRMSALQHVLDSQYNKLISESYVVQMCAENEPENTFEERIPRM